MAHVMYDRLLREAAQELAVLLKADDPSYGLPEGTNPPAVPAMNAAQSYDYARRSYLRYLTVYRTLERVFRGSVHPQKRQDVAELIESVLARLAQLRAVIVKFAPFNPEVAEAQKGRPLIAVPSEYTVFDDVLADLKLQPEATEVPPPRQFIDNRDEERRKREALVGGYMNLKLGVEKVLVELEEPLIEAAVPTVAMAPEEAIALILRNERGRQGAIRAAAQKEDNAIKARAVAEAKAASDRVLAAAGAGSVGGDGDEEEKKDGEEGDGGGEPRVDEETRAAAAAAAAAAHAAALQPKRKKHAPRGEDDEDEADLLTPNEAAVMIQTLVRSFVAKRKARRMRKEELAFLGMREGKKAELDGLLAAMGGVVTKRLLDQANNKDALKSSLPDLHKLVLEEEGGGIRDRLKAERLAWLTNQLAQGIIPEDMNAFYAFQAEAAGGGAAAAAAAAAAEAEAKAKAEADAKAKAAAAEGPQPEVPPALVGATPWSKRLGELLATYRDKWSTRDEKNNPHQKHEESLARVVVRPAVTEEVRLQVDASLADQLANFKAAQADKKKDKKKKEKKPKEKKKKEKPLPGAKLCTGMDTDAMLSELVTARVVNNPRSTATFDNFFGPPNLLASSYNAKDTPAQRHPVTKHWMPLDPSMAQVRESLVANCVLPLGSREVRVGWEEFAAANKIGKGRCPRAVLLYGPHGSGKTHLAQAVANATGAMFFNLSAGNTEGKFTEKGGQAKLLHMAFEVAKDPAMGPAVIYIDEVEKMIPGPPPKGKPKPDPNGPARFKKELPIYINSLTAEHAVTVIACTTEPEAADPKSVGDCFDRIVYVPCPDYATRLLAWKRELHEVFSIVPEPQPVTMRTLAAKKGGGGPAAAGAGGSNSSSSSSSVPVVDPAPWSADSAANVGAPSSEASSAAGATGAGNSSAALAGFGPLPLSPSATYVDDRLMHPLIAGLNFGALATISNGYTVGSIKGAIKTACTLRRLDALDVRPMEEMDFVNALARCPRMYADQSERYADFAAKATGLEAARVVEDAAAAGGKPPPKKK